jgi:hypothetical protein
MINTPEKFSEFDGFEMQNQLTAFKAFCGDEAGGFERGSDRCGGELVSQVAKRFDGDFAGDLAFQTGFVLLGVVF